jgi:uncharacterized membrane protein
VTATSLFAAIILALVHLLAGKMRFLYGIPRSRWLSIAGGISVAYVFVHLIPELSVGQETLTRAVGEVFGFIEHHVYLISLIGLVKTSRRTEREAGKADETDATVFWIYIASFAIYNGLIGYLLLHRETETLQSLLFFLIAMALHFIVTDYGLASFAGIGPKCANLVLGIACGKPGIGVDVHVHRVTNRWGYVQASTPERTMHALEIQLPRVYWVEINRLLVAL